MGLLDEYAIDVEEYDEASYDNPDDGYYDFEIADVFIRQGTDNNPDKSWIIIRYIVGDTGKSKDEWFQLPEDVSDPTDKERQSLGFYRSRLTSLGFASEQHGQVDRDDLIGLTGTFKLETRKGYQNIYNLKTGTDEAPVQAAPAKPATRPAARPAGRPAARPGTAPAAPAQPRAGRPATAPARPAARPAPKPAPEPEPEAPEDEDAEQYEGEETEEQGEVQFVAEPPAEAPVRRGPGRPATAAPRQAARAQAATKQATAAGVRPNPFG